jgi:hypothetical protein
MPLTGQITMTNPARRLVLESEMVDNSPGLGLLPWQLNLLWWGIGGGRDARVMVTNTGPEAVLADAFLDFQGERHTLAPLSFLPFESKVLSIIEMLGALDVSPAQAPEGGITIVPRGPRATLVAQGRITDPATGFSTTLNVLDPLLQQAHALHASGLPLGTPAVGSPYLRMGTFVPHVIVRNLTADPQAVALTLEYPGQDGTDQVTLAPITLEGYTTEDISLEPSLGLLVLPVPFVSVRIQYSGYPGSVVAEVASVEQQSDLVIDGRLANEGDGWAGSGANPWHLDEETDSIQFLTNMGERECRIAFTVQAEGVHYYLTDLVLKARETRAIDLRRLRDAQKPDFQGNVLPADATDGSVNWIRVDNVPVMGRVVMLRRKRGLASSYACGTCRCPVTLFTASTSPGTVVGLPGGTQQFTCTATYRDCNSGQAFVNVTSWSTWSSTNTPVATVNNTTQKGLATAVAGGTAQIRATYTDCYQYTSLKDEGCTCVSNLTATPSSTCDVQVPTSLRVVSVTTIPTGSVGGCTTASNFGIRIAIRYEVRDQKSPSAPIKRSDMLPQEKLLNYVLNGENLGDPVPNWVNIGPSGYPGTSTYTDANGQFLDAPFGTCADGQFVNTYTQPISIVFGTFRFPVRTNNINVSSSSAGHGTISNGSDIQKTR